MATRWRIFGIQSLQDEVLQDVEEDAEAGELAKYLCKIYIPNEDRVECLRHLRMMNVHHASLFPDLIGASNFCNIMVAEEAQQMKEEKIARDQHRATTQPTPEPTTEPKPAVEIAPADALIEALRTVLSTPSRRRAGGSVATRTYCARGSGGDCQN